MKYSNLKIKSNIKQIKIDVQLELELSQIEVKETLNNSINLKRFKLISQLENLILNNFSSDAAKELEAKLWKLGFYAPVEAYRQLITDSKQANGSQNYQLQFNQFLQKSIGFYFNLIGGIDHITKFNILEKVTKFDLDWDVDPVKDFNWFIYFKCFIRMGDLARYQTLETHSRHAALLADRYYRVALKIMPDQGHPYNQLGVLRAMQNDFLDAVHCYFRSLLIAHPFPTSLTNLKTIFSQAAHYQMPQSTQPSEIANFKLLICQLLAHVFLKSDSDTLEDLKSRIETSMQELFESSERSQLQDALNFVTLTLICAKEILCNVGKSVFYSEEASNQLDIIITTYGDQLIVLSNYSNSTNFKSVDKMSDSMRLVLPSVLLYARWVLDTFTRDAGPSSRVLEACDTIITFCGVFSGLKLDTKGKRQVALPELRAYRSLTILSTLEAPNWTGVQVQLNDSRKEDAYRIKQLTELSKLLEVKQEQADDDQVFQDLSKNIDHRHFMEPFDLVNGEVKSQATPPLYSLPSAFEHDEEENDEILNIPNLINPTVTSSYSRKGSAFALTSDMPDSTQSSLFTNVGVGSSHYLNSGPTYNPSAITAPFGQSAVGFGARSKSFTNFGSFFGSNTASQPTTQGSNFSLLGATNSGYDNGTFIPRGNRANSVAPTSIAPSAQFPPGQSTAFGSNFGPLSGGVAGFQEPGKFDTLVTSSTSHNPPSLLQYPVSQNQPAAPGSSNGIFNPPSLRYNPRGFERSPKPANRGGFWNQPHP